MRDHFERLAGARVDLVKGSGGVFEITVDGTLAFSKKAAGRFPEDGEVEALAAAGA